MISRGAPLLPGSRLGPYELVALLSRGGMGEVWIARPPGRSACVALKTILPSRAGDDSARRLFQDEGAIATRLDHPNLARGLDAGESDGVLYYTMEWIDGAPRDEVLAAAAAAGRRVSLPVLLRIVMDVAAGLHAAHEARDAVGVPLGIVHRDVSPHNVLVGRDGVAKVTDFGIARARERLARTTTGNFRGKLPYVSPEHARGDAVDRRSDVWSLGVVLQEGMSGRRPFDSLHEAGVLSKILEGTPTFVFDADVPRELVAVVRRALARHPAARHPTADELGRDLASVAASLGLEASAADVAAELRALLGAELDRRRAAAALEPRARATGLRRRGGALAATLLLAACVTLGAIVGAGRGAKADPAQPIVDPTPTHARGGPPRDEAPSDLLSAPVDAMFFELDAPATPPRAASPDAPSPPPRPRPRRAPRAPAPPAAATAPPAPRSASADPGF